MVVVIEGRWFKVCHELEDVLILGFEGMRHAAMDDRTKRTVGELETAHMYASKDLHQFALVVKTSQSILLL